MHQSGDGTKQAARLPPVYPVRLVPVSIGRAALSEALAAACEQSQSRLTDGREPLQVDSPDLTITKVLVEVVLPFNDTGCVQWRAASHWPQHICGAQPSEGWRKLPCALWPQWLPLLWLTVTCHCEWYSGTGE